MLKTNIRKYDTFKLYYWHDAILVGKYKFPQITLTQAIPHDVVGFNERTGVKNPEQRWLDFFIDDALFECFWDHPDVYFDRLHRFEGVVGTDYSMYPEMPPGQRIWNCFCNRTLDYYLQQNGFCVVPVASWCLAEDFEWCFDGLPENGTIAISSNGCMSSPYSRKIFLQGVKELQKRKSPTTLVVCGRHIDALDAYSNITYYPCFSQRWKERVG